MIRNAHSATSSLSTTNDDNRNYYYGVETFFYTNTYVIVPAIVGWFIVGTDLRGWFGGDPNTAYRIVTGCVFVLTIFSSIIVHRGQFENPPKSDFVFFRYHWLWNRMQLLAILKGLAQGYIVTAPAMLVMRLVGRGRTRNDPSRRRHPFGVSAVLDWAHHQTSRPPDYLHNWSRTLRPGWPGQCVVIQCRWRAAVYDMPAA